MVATTSETGFADASAIFRAAVLSTWAPRVTLWPDEWADRYRTMPPGVGPYAGQKWDTNRTPYLREPMRAWADPELRKLVLVFGSQTAKTELWTNVTLWEQCTNPCWYVFGLPSLDKAKEINERRMQPSIKASPAILHRLAGGRDAMSLKAVSFEGGGTVQFIGAGSDAQAKSTPAPRVIADETEEMGPEFVSLLKERGKAFVDAKYGLSSTPGNEGEGIDAETEGCQHHEHSVPCPHCHEYFALTFDLVRWGGEFVVLDEDGREQKVVKRGSECTPEEAERTARVVCPTCGGECYDYHKPWMLARGVWLVEGERASLDASPAGPGAAGAGAKQTVNVTGEVDGVVMTELGHVLPAVGGQAITTIHNAQPKRKSRSYRLNSLYSGMMTWSRFVYDFAELYRYTITPEFKRGYLAQAWAPPGDKPQVEELKTICQRSGYRLRVGGQREGETKRSPLPEAVRLLTVGVDLQQDEAWVHVTGWGAHCRDSYLVDFGPVKAREGYDLEAIIAPVMARHYETVDGRQLVPYAMAIDSGFRTQDVYDLAIAWRGRRQLVLPVKGQPGSKMLTTLRPTNIDRFPDGRMRPHGVPLLNINTDDFKALVMGAVKASAAEGDAVQAIDNEGLEDHRGTRAGVNHRLWLPGDCPESYLRHMTSERRQAKSLSKRAKAKYRYAADDGYEWVRLKGHRNEGLDTTVYQFALVGFKQLGRMGRVEMDQLSGALANPGREPRPLSGLEERLKRINARRGRRV